MWAKEKIHEFIWDCEEMMRWEVPENMRQMSEREMSLFNGLYKIENGKVILLKGFKYADEDTFREKLQTMYDKEDF